MKLHRSTQPRLAFDQCQRTDVIAVELEQIEEVVVDRHRALTSALRVTDLHPPLEALEAGPAIRERDDLAVDEQIRAGDRERVDELGVRPVERLPAA